MFDFIIVMIFVELGVAMDTYTTFAFAGVGGLVELNPLGVTKTMIFKVVMLTLCAGFAAVSSFGFGILGFFGGLWFMAGIHNILQYFTMKSFQKSFAPFKPLVEAWDNKQDEVWNDLPKIDNNGGK